MASNRTIQKQLEKKGWKFKFYMNGSGLQAEKGRRKVKGTSKTAVFKKIRGY